MLIVAMLAGTACFIPEKFRVDVEVNRDGTYSLSYVGTIAFAPDREAWVHEGTSPQLVAADADVAVGLLKEPACKEAVPLGDGRFRIRWEQAGKLTTPLYFLNEQEYVVKLIPQSGNKVKVQGLRLSTDEVKQLAQLKLTVDGELSVDTDGAVVETNAEGKPWLLGIGAYTWHIGEADVHAPRILIQR